MLLANVLCQITNRNIFWYLRILSHFRIFHLTLSTSSQSHDTLLRIQYVTEHSDILLLEYVTF